MVARTYWSINAFLLSIFAAAAIGLVGACENTARGLKEDAARAEQATRDEGAQARENAKGVANDAAQAARTVGHMAAAASEEVAERASAVRRNVNVKAALMADPAVDATRIDVDADYRTRTLSLKGFVPTEGERSRAEAIAKDKAQGYTVVNHITVQPRA
jgi:osmotically-inducible protein OsmY